MSNFFITDNQGNKIEIPVKQRNGRGLISNILAFAIYGCFGLLSGFVIVAYYVNDIEFTKSVWDGVNNIVIMIVGGFLALIKEIFHPRREITVDNVIDLVNKMSEVKRR